MSAEATNISKLSIITEAKSGEAVKSLQSLASALTTLKNASKGGFSGINKAADAIKNLMAEIHTISEADLGKLERLSAALAGIKGFKFSAGGKSSGSSKGGKLTRYTALAGGGGTGELALCTIFFPDQLAIAYPIALAIGNLVDPPATMVNAAGDYVVSYIVARFADGKDWLQKQLKK